MSESESFWLIYNLRSDNKGMYKDCCYLFFKPKICLKASPQRCREGPRLSEDPQKVPFAVHSQFFCWEGVDWGKALCVVKGG